MADNNVGPLQILGHGVVMTSQAKVLRKYIKPQGQLSRATQRNQVDGR